VNAASAVATELDLYRRGVATAVACWTSYARDAAVDRDGPGVYARQGFRDLGRILELAPPPARP
jgi:hypothetical protein